MKFYTWSLLANIARRRDTRDVLISMCSWQWDMVKVGVWGWWPPPAIQKQHVQRATEKKSPPHLDWPSTWIVHLRIYPSFSTLTTILPMFIATGKSMVDLNIIDPKNATILERVSYYSCVPLNRNAQYSGLCRFKQRNLSTSICRKRIEHTKLQSLKGRATTDGSPLKCCI